MNVLSVLYLATKSDISTILIPATIYAASSSSTSWGHLPHSAFWVWLHLLQFCVSNQIASLDEDAINKPWRPLPAKRVSLHHYRLLRQALVPLCLFTSFAMRRGMLQSIVLVVATWANNELSLDSHWVMRNIMVAIGYAAFNTGAVEVAGGQIENLLDDQLMRSLLINALVILTTMHAQDFRDLDGDKLRARKTLPIVFPLASRLSMLLNLTSWSMLLSLLYPTSEIVAMAFTLGGLFVGYRFLAYRTKQDDTTSYTIYNLWLCGAQIIPLLSTSLSRHGALTAHNGWRLMA